jgi:hypothetical protein
MAIYLFKRPLNSIIGLLFFREPFIFDWRACEGLIPAMGIKSRGATPKDDDKIDCEISVDKQSIGKIDANNKRQSLL